MMYEWSKSHLPIVNRTYSYLLFLKLQVLAFS